MDTTEDFKHILLFKTNINSDTEKQFLHGLFDGNPDIKCWNIDMDDSDRVLRIVSATLSHTQIIEIITHRGYQCCELT